MGAAPPKSAGLFSVFPNGLSAVAPPKRGLASVLPPNKGADATALPKREPPAAGLLPNKLGAS